METKRFFIVNRLKRAAVSSILLIPFVTPLITAEALADDSGSVPLATSVSAGQYMIVTANPLATAAGERVLRAGGFAADAMVAAQTVLGLVEPQSSGLGGGAFAVYYDALTDELTTFDAREKAPATAEGDRFLDDNGESIGFFAAWQSGLSVGVPGTPKLMQVMHDRYGVAPWRSLFLDARRLARDGYPLTQRTSDQVERLLGFNTRFGSKCGDDRLFFRDPAAADYFVDFVTTESGELDCMAKPAGTIIKNPAYLNTLTALARDGGDAFYTGDIAQGIVDAVTTDPNIPGDMTLADVAGYAVIEREPVCIDYRGYPVCGMGPPSSGALAVGQILGILENFAVGMEDPVMGDLSDVLNVDTVHLFTQAGRLAFADRGQFVGDSDFVTVPIDGMLDKDYLEQRAMLINRFQDLGSVEAGTPPGVADASMPDARTKDSGTSHISIVDRHGNALSMTTTIESSLGNGVMTGGFLLNNELTDFSFNPGTEEEPVANRVQGGKRPRSSMSPTIVFDGNTDGPDSDNYLSGPRWYDAYFGYPGRKLERGQVELVTGSPGGSRIIGYTAQSIMNHIDFGLDPQDSINVPHYMNRNGRTDIEAPIPGLTLDYDAEALQQALLERGHSNGGAEGETSVGVIQQTSGLSIINVTGRTLIGGADKRRDGTAAGR
ncbi:MAG: gamma-glutamyltransferase family protein [Granulosicoccus sp.]